MSVLSFLSPSGTANLAGPERHHLNHLATTAAHTAWDLDRVDALDQVSTIIGMMPEPVDTGLGENHLHEAWRRALDRRERYHAARQHHDAAGVTGAHNPARQGLDLYADHQLAESLSATLRHGETSFRVAGVHLDCRSLTLNTTLAIGSAPLQLATKLSGWTFTYVEGPDRAWLADVIAQGRASGIYRSGMGWEEIITLLRSRDDAPVVTEHSTDDTFPSRDLVDWQPPTLPAGWVPSWAGSDAGRAQWDALPDSERFRLGVEGMRVRRPWTRLAPDTLGTVGFGNQVTIYHLMEDDRDTVVAAVLEQS